MKQIPIWALPREERSNAQVLKDSLIKKIKIRKGEVQSLTNWLRNIESILQDDEKQLASLNDKYKFEE